MASPWLRECHDHKFDPVTQREFYQLYAFFMTPMKMNIDAPLRREWKEYHEAKDRMDLKRTELLAPWAATLAAAVRLGGELLRAEANPGVDHRGAARWKYSALSGDRAGGRATRD